MIQAKSLLRRTSYVGAAASLLLAVAAYAVPTSKASAAMITDRSLQISNSAASAEVTHTYRFKAATAHTIESITLEFCTTAFGYVGVGACAEAPAGFDVSNVTSMTVTNTTLPVDPANNEVLEATDVAANYLELRIAADTGVGVPVNIGDEIEITTTGGHFVNPSANGTFFAHIVTYSDDNVTTAVDNGTVTSSVANQINLETRVEETLNFSVGTANDDDTGCAPLTTNNLLELGDPINHALSTTQTYDELSYFRIATNASNGAQVLYSGDTLNSITNAGDDINPVNPKDTIQVGVEQFGIVIDESEIDLTGAALDPAANYADGGTNQIHFDDGSVTTPVPVAASTGAIDCETAAVRYVANISNSTPAGIYTTTISYIAVPSY